MNLKYKVEKDNDEYIVSLANTSQRVTKQAFEDCLKMSCGQKDPEKFVYEAALGVIYHNFFGKELGLLDFVSEIEKSIYRINECSDDAKRTALTKTLAQKLRVFFALEYD